MSDVLGLNAPQQEAVEYLDGPCLVLAGAGSGKTRVITHKIAYLINSGRYLAKNIAALTFTNKAAQEMQKRLVSLGIEKSSIKQLTACTFHSLGVQILREEAMRLGFKARFSIMDAGDCLTILQDMLSSTDKGFIKGVQSCISLWKNNLIAPDAVSPSNELEVDAARLYPLYVATLKAYQAVDFDDLLILPVHLFRTDQAVRDKWQSRLRYLLIDEYQDTNVAQYELIKLLTTGLGKKAMFSAVGDDDQAIYAWRGATLDNLEKIRDDFADLKVIPLEQNYRSTNTILQAANTLIGHNPKLFDKKLWSNLGMGEAIEVTAMDDDNAEAEQVVAHLSRHKFEHRTEFSDYAILYRSNHQARIFEEALRNERIPYKLSGGQSFFDRAEIRDIVSYLRLMVNDNDDLAFIRAITTPRRGVGQTTLEALGEFARQWQCSLFEAVFKSGLTAYLSARQIEPMRVFCEFINQLSFRAEKEPVAQLLDELRKEIDYEPYLYSHFDEVVARNKWQNVLDFCDWLGKKGERDEKNLIQLTQVVMLVSMLEERDADPNMVQLSTLHAAKGLEYRYVFLIGVEEGLLPYQNKDEKEDAQVLQARLEEERRLMYVGITRARNNLFISWCRRRKRARQNEACEISRFIAEMGLEKIESLPVAKLSPQEHLARMREMLAPK